MSVESILERIMSEVPKAVAGGVVDVGSGMLLGAKTVDSHPQEVLDLVAAASRDVFEGDNIIEIENIFKKTRGDSTEEHYFNEIIINSKNLVHFFGRLKAEPSTIMTVVCRADVNLGLMVTKSRSIAASEVS